MQNYDMIHQTEPKRIAILGSTGSIGTQALDALQHHNNAFSVEVLTANDNAQQLIAQAKQFEPEWVVIGNKQLYPEVKAALPQTKVLAGSEGIARAAAESRATIVLSALVGYAGLQPTVSAIESGKTIALANKETLVVGGSLITQLAKEKQVDILPVDSEHSAIFQCIQGEEHNPAEKIYLTASGGPFFNTPAAELTQKKPADALKHPNWDMGAKITIDSASMMNKGFEVIEAYWLFNLNIQQIEVIVHPQSIIHSLVQFEDGAMKAQLGLPDMKQPILYALFYPKRIKTTYQRFNFADYPQLTFYQPDRKKFPCLQLAYDALQKGGNMPCVLNAANEVAVEAFLKEKIAFTQIPQIIEQTMQAAGFEPNPQLSDFVECDNESRHKATEAVGRLQ